MVLVESLFVIIFTLAFATPSRADSLFAATAAGGLGRLYELNPKNGSIVRDIGPLSDVQGINYPVTGIAFDPLTGDLYGSTGGRDVVAGARLIKVDERTGFVTVVGAFNVTVQGDLVRMTDLAFDSDGNLFGVDSAEARLYSINLTTGQATVISATAITNTVGGALAISLSGAIFGIPSQQLFGTYDKTTGAFTTIGAPMNFFTNASYGSLAFDSAGTLFGMNLGTSADGNPTALVKIDPVTNTFVNLGSSVPRADAIAFQVPEPSAIQLCGVAAVFSLAGRRTRRRKAHRPAKEN